MMSIHGDYYPYPLPLRRTATLHYFDDHSLVRQIHASEHHCLWKQRMICDDRKRSMKKGTLEERYIVLQTHDSERHPHYLQRHKIIGDDGCIGESL